MSNVEVSPDGRSSHYKYGDTTNPTLDEQIDRAIDRMKDQPSPLAAASQLFLRWSESDSSVRDLLPPLVEDYIRKRVAERAKAKK